MALKKIKTWIDLKRNPQFIVLERYDDGVNIKAVQRIKDDGIFIRYMPINIAGRDEFIEAFYIVNFHDDMRTVDWELNEIEHGVRKGSCSIDYIFMTEDWKLDNVVIKKTLTHRK